MEENMNVQTINETTLEDLQKQLCDLDIDYKHRRKELESLINDMKAKLRNAEISKALRECKETLMYGGLSESAAEEIIKQQIFDQFNQQYRRS